MIEGRNIELGQAFLSGNGVLEHDYYEAESGLYALAQIVAVRLGRPAGWDVPEFANTAFTIRPYCWCDNEEHPDGCPPNFAHRYGLRINWYKHIGRGMSANWEYDDRQWVDVLVDCIRSIDDYGV